MRSVVTQSVLGVSLAACFVHSVIASQDVYRPSSTRDEAYKGVWSGVVRHDLADFAIGGGRLAYDERVVLRSKHTGSFYVFSKEGHLTRGVGPSGEDLNRRLSGDRYSWCASGAVARVWADCTTRGCTVTFYEPSGGAVTHEYSGRFLCSINGIDDVAISSGGGDLLRMSGSGQVVASISLGPLGGCPVNMLVAAAAGIDGTMAVLSRYYPRDDQGHVRPEGRSAVFFLDKGLSVVDVVHLPDQVEDDAYGIDYDGRWALVFVGGRSAGPHGALWLIDRTGDECIRMSVRIEGEEVSPFRASLVSGNRVGFLSAGWDRVGFIHID